MKKLIIYLTHKYKGNIHKIYKAIKKNEKINENELSLILEEIKENNIQFVTILDKNYPKKLINANTPPLMLFYKGDISIINDARKQIYLTGSYETTSIISYINSLDKNNDITFVSLLWPLLEKKIASILLNKNNKVIVLLPCGINWAINNLKLDKFIHENCLFLSEFPDNYHPTKEAFSSRNRIIASICDELILLSSLDKKYESLINQFLDLGKDIKCMLSKEHYLNDNNIELINEGATLIT